jgi:hypothetical protein
MANIDPTEKILNAEPPIASFLKSLLIGGGPVNAAVRCSNLPGPSQVFFRRCPMNDEKLIRRLIRGSIQRAIQESIAAVIVLVVFANILFGSVVGGARYYGCLIILVATGFIVGVVWSHALSYRLLRSHPVSDAGFWREAFHAQARLLRLLPLWYCAPVGIGAIFFVVPIAVPTAVVQILPLLLVASIFLVVFGSVIWLNRKAAACLDDAARLLAD